MFAFLGVVSDDDLERSIIEPSYVLCKTVPITGYTAGYRIVAMDSRFKELTKVLVTTLTGHEDLIEYMSTFRTVKYYRKKDRTRKVVHGAMFWFPCNEFGERTKEQAIFITKVPVKGKKQEEGKQRMESIRENKDTRIKTLLSQEPATIVPDEWINKKKKTYRMFGRRRKNNGEERECSDLCSSAGYSEGSTEIV